MKDTLDNELDKFDTDNRFLFMDPEAEKVSFTSDRNKAPKTLQIILRTDEISLDSDDNKPTDVETEKEHVSPLRRMWNVLVKMWQAIVSIFKERGPPDEAERSCPEPGGTACLIPPQNRSLSG